MNLNMSFGIHIGKSKLKRTLMPKSITRGSYIGWVWSTTFGGIWKGDMEEFVMIVGDS